MKGSMVVFIFMMFFGLFFNQVNAQYQIRSFPEGQEIDQLSDFVENLNAEIRHGKIPDSLFNNTGIDLLVHIVGPSDSTFPGLKNPSNIHNQPQFTNKLENNAGKQINFKKLRRGKDIQVKLVVTVPGVQDAQGNWTTKPVKWDLGERHAPTYTEINFLNEKDGYQIIFRYEKGLPVRNTEPHPQERIHIEGHFCDPTKEECL